MGRFSSAENPALPLRQSWVRNWGQCRAPSRSSRRRRSGVPDIDLAWKRAAGERCSEVVGATAAARRKPSGLQATAVIDAGGNGGEKTSRPALVSHSLRIPRCAEVLPPVASRRLSGLKARCRTCGPAPANSQRRRSAVRSLAGRRSRGARSHDDRARPGCGSASRRWTCSWIPANWPIIESSARRGALRVDEADLAAYLAACRNEQTEERPAPPPAVRPRLKHIKT